MDIMGTAAAKFSLSVIDIFYYLTEFIAGIATGNWARAWEGLKNILKGAVNGIIGLINSLLSGLAAGINAVVRSLNDLHVTVPDWVPILGGREFGFHINPITAPQIPLLAQGAVLPANKPFLAMVGDQRHGTNIEAPLGVIQEAVALVMRDQTDALMAGFSASVEVQREILSAVLGISIGDEVIASAYDHYRTRQAVMKGASHGLSEKSCQSFQSKNHRNLDRHGGLFRTGPEGYHHRRQCDDRGVHRHRLLLWHPAREIT